jgi:hypothetical protein
VNPADPESAQQIVAEYAQLLDRDLQEGRLPAALDSLPYAKPTIKEAIETATLTLISSGQMTDDLRDFLQTAYVSLADYIAADLVQLMREFTQAGDDLAADSRLAREKTGGAAWQRVTESSRLAGEIARSIAEEATVLQSEFQQFVGDPKSVAPPV